MHLGNARTALLACLQVRAAGGRFVMRVEDLDRGRCRPAYERGVLEDLRWLLLDWDEGPDVGGPFGPYRQSECAEVYERACATLPTYACTCSRKEVREATLAPHGAEPVYPGTCRGGATRPGRPAALRWRAPAGTVEVEDALLGALRQDIEREVGDFVVRRSDGAWAYQLAVVVDDARMGITHVLRGEDLCSSTPRQVLLHRALGSTPPAFAHVPLLRGPDGEKLSKRHGAPDLAALRRAGADPRRVVAWLAASLQLVGPSVQRVTPHELAPDFDLRAVERARDHPLDADALPRLA
jgi:glutamyl-tRNA synthetase